MKYEISEQTLRTCLDSIDGRLRWFNTLSQHNRDISRDYDLLCRARSEIEEHIFIDKSQIVHGLSCLKKQHLGAGYVHVADDDGPYEVDGVIYCGRCHEALTNN